MPTERERVPNKALSGTELKQLILADVVKMLDNDGMLSAMIGYGRVAYDFRLALHIDNPLHPESSIEQRSRPIARNIVSGQPNLAAVESAPLADPSSESVVAGTELHRNVTSPNAERLRLGLPVPVEVKQADSTIITEHISYPPDPAAGPGDVTVTDVTSDVRAEWKVKETSR